jgi:hypothetical protein
MSVKLLAFPPPGAPQELGAPLRLAERGGATMVAKRKDTGAKSGALAEIGGRWTAPSGTGDGSKLSARGGQSVTPSGRSLFVVGGRCNQDG